MITAGKLDVSHRNERFCFGKKEYSRQKLAICASFSVKFRLSFPLFGTQKKFGSILLQVINGDVRRIISGQGDINDTVSKFQ